MSVPVGRVLGTQDSMPLDFWIAVEEGQFVQLDDVVLVETALPDGQIVKLFGVVDLVRARHEGARFDSDVFLAESGVLPVTISQAAHVRVTRVDPEIFVPPLPGRVVLRAAGVDRDQALFFDGMARRLPIGLSRDGEPVYANLDFLDGSRGAHVSVSGISGVATKTTYATFLLHSLFNSGVLGSQAAGTHAIIFNVKGEDLLFLDRPNRFLTDEARGQYARLGLEATAFDSAQFLAPVRPGSKERLPDTGSRQRGVQAYFWTIRQFVEERFLRFLFAEADDATSQLSFVVDQVEAKLATFAVEGKRTDPWIEIEDVRVETFDQLVDVIAANVEHWATRAAPGTVAAFERRMRAAAARVGFLIRGRDVGKPREHLLDWRARQVSIIDIHTLHDRAKRFVVGVILKRMFEEKETLGSRQPLVFVVLDELNKYAPRDEWSPIKEVLLDISERGRSLGIILIGAQQTASEVERRIVANASLRVVGRLDLAEAERPEYGFLSAAGRGRASILKPGTMVVMQPEIPTPLLVQFPFPAWATSQREAQDADVTEESAFRGFGKK
jgi:hypothetical protein